MFWTFLIRSTSGLIVDKVLEKSFEKIKGQVNMLQRQREKNKFSKMYYNKILKKYGDSPYYDSVLRFILKNKIIEAIFNNHSSSMNKTKGDQRLISYYIELYKEQNKASVEHTLFTRKLLFDLYYEILSFNLSSDYIPSEEKIISNQNLNSQNIMDGLEKIRDEVKYEFIQSRKYIAAHTETNDNRYGVDEDMLNKYKEKVLKEHQSKNYTPRKIESIVSSKIYNDSYQLLKEKKKITITGEAGIGKSTEASNIIRIFLEDEALQNYIPVYLNLAHYGVLYESLKEGINQTLSEFVQSEKNDALLNNEKLFIILDGFDEINDVERIEKALAEIDSLSFKFNDNYYFLTIRENQINNRISEEYIYRLLPYDRSQLVRILNENNMPNDFENDYMELLRNPLFLELAINLYNKSDQYLKLNKSDLIEAIILDLLTNVSSKYSTSTILNLLANFSYDFFKQNSYTPINFEEYIENRIANAEASRSIINSLIQSNIFKVNEFTIEFTYKIFKDYFCSRYLLNLSKEERNLDFLKRYIDKTEWEEPLILLVGLIENLEDQTNLLDVYMKSNIKLYVKSVESKNNLYDELKKISLKDYVQKLGVDFLETYEYLIERYFFEIISLIYPYSSLSRDKNLNDYHLNLVMYVTEDKKWISYFLRLVPITESRLQLVTDINHFRELSKQFHTDFSIQSTIKTQTKSLEYNNLTGDSGRLLAVTQLKSELDELIENHGLFHSLYIFLENLKVILKKVDFVKELDSIDEIIDKLEKHLATFNDGSLETDIFDMGLIWGHTKIDIVELYKSLLPFRNKNISFSNYRFIEPDIDYTESNGYIWSLYSIDKRKEIINEFFEIGNSSVYQMFCDNFPLLTEYLTAGNSIPYRTDVYIENNLDIEEDTSLSYVDIPVEKEKQIETRIFEVDEKQRNFESIQKKYESYSFEKKPTRMTSTGFAHICLSGRSFNIPMTDYVYDEVKSRLESIFGKLK